MKVAELSRLTGISIFGLHRIYNEKTHSISFRVLERLCTVLQVRVEDIIEYVPDTGAKN